MAYMEAGLSAAATDHLDIAGRAEAVIERLRQRGPLDVGTGSTRVLVALRNHAWLDGSVHS